MFAPKQRVKTCDLLAISNQAELYSKGTIQQLQEY